MTTTTQTRPTTWIDACPTHRLHPEDGLAILLPDHTQIALFRTRDGHLYAVDNIDPYTGAAVISRGIVGDRAGEPTVASPMLKNVFSLRTGQSLDDTGVHLSTWPVRQGRTTVQIATRAKENTP
ncbi:MULTISPECIES: nitrite reductase small subunit NirD [Nocardiopsis]|uniref:Nitrite reductase (NADH) small subunit n=1 Tax=Nocardiopsis sinuspersici TaxID=501010 RepID=A0A1V3C021_9ACTN|nr:MULTISPECIES: nitrite reductase small subunit NirD [Nocardiopsis]NYH55117.1 nitrite reductase (NADH) small subunit [Nocardiopsis sinuspersici]OOC53829.1 nitrite reductase small subunit [Nocardiopsis sinuspersici]